MKGICSNLNMAVTNQLELRANYLQHAAHLLAISSPSAAAFLGSARDRLIEDAELTLSPKELAATRREICGACGNLLVPGWSCKVSNRAEQTRKKLMEKELKKPEQALESTRPEKGAVYTCLRCHRETVHKIQQRQPSRANRRGKTIAETLQQTIQDEKNFVLRNNDGGEARNNTINANSKQRQKARKGGLLAMLEKNKAANSSSSSALDWMDFAM